MSQSIIEELDNSYEPNSILRLNIAKVTSSLIFSSVPTNHVVTRDFPINWYGMTTPIVQFHTCKSAWSLCAILVQEHVMQFIWIRWVRVHHLRVITHLKNVLAELYTMQCTQGGYTYKLSLPSFSSDRSHAQVVGIILMELISLHTPSKLTGPNIQYKNHAQKSNLLKKNLNIKHQAETCSVQCRS